MMAILSDCGRYRYTLEREWMIGAGTCLFVMLNPSTADAEQDDPTIRRCIRFAQRWGYQQLTVGNLFAYRATDPADLLHTAPTEVIGPDNDMHLRDLAHGASLIVAAWGSHAAAAYSRVAPVVEILGEAEAECVCLGVTKDGSPRHPLYVRGDIEPTLFRLMERTET